MPISAVTSAFSAYAQQVVSGTPSGSTSAANSAQEATETPAQTLKEARHGDPVAKQKLRKIQAQQQQQQTSPTQSSPATEPGKGALLDHAA